MTNTIEIENLNISDLDIPTDETLQEVATACENIATSSESIATSCDNVATSCNSLAKDTTLQSTNTALGSLATDATLQATNTALGGLNTSLGGIIKDATGQSIDTSVGNISTVLSDVATDTTLATVAKDTTLQATNTALGSLMADTTGQDIKTAINNLAGAISPAASNVTFDNTVSGLSSSNAQGAIDEVNEKANTALQISNGSTTASWGTTASIPRTAQFKSILVIGGRLNKGFMVFIPSGTNEYVILSNVNSCITSVSVTSSAINIALSSSGYGSNIIINTIVLI